MSVAIVLLRNDLRLADQPALQAALRLGHAPLLAYVHAPDEEGDWAPGAASDAWRHRSLQAMEARLRGVGARLHLFRGPTLATVQAIVEASGAEAVFWSRRYEPAIEARDTRLKRELRAQGLHVESHNASLMFEPWQVQTKQGDPYRVFTPFWRTALSQWRLPDAMPAPERLPLHAALPGEVALDALGLQPSLGWDKGFWEDWTPGELGAEEALRRFIDERLHDYAKARDVPSVAGTSRMSPHLHFGEISPRQIARALLQTQDGSGREASLRELGWREFAHHVLHHFPQTTDANFNPRFDDFPWARPARADLEAWRHGRTGVPIIDAGMRELWQTGWMHNRVRMIVASFLTKHLRAHWREGARWFWDTLVDADLANNSLGWQWAAGTGVDAAPYVRVFNPVLQASRFDPKGEYIARWVPELAGLPAPLRHAPWEQPALARAAGYPSTPIVDLAEGRKAALAAFETIRVRTPD
ncbi:cryptochrome/photolyase family protein [Luteimonas sp. RIT-PG2_3]